MGRIFVQYDEEKFKDLLKEYKRGRISLLSMSKQLGISYATLYRIFLSKNIPRNYVGSKIVIYDKSKLPKLISRYKSNKIGVVVFANELGITTRKVVNILRSKGITIHKKGQRLSENDLYRKNIVQDFYDGKISSEMACKLLVTSYGIQGKTSNR